ncbi:uncharacterized protein LOC111345488 [Stylophora pistillata]|uniref:uncharacterized protein LOC111345488 n=1 Tax=Stylophora pistillata TaxID=50429 RepID=UPI000C0517EA|nr:uncharacterized protein LOC111345488 [Stylophora pistillata]
MTNNENTQLTTVNGYNPKKRMIFSKPISGEIPDSKPKIEFKRINISTLNEDGTEGELILPTERLYSFGISENTSQETDKVTGYTFPLCLWNRDGATEEDKIWVETFKAIVDWCIDHLVENREEIDMFEFERSDLTKSKGGLNPLYWKMQKVLNEKTGKIVQQKDPNRGPTLYAKLIYSKKTDKFCTKFFDLNDEEIDAHTLMGKYCHAKCAIKIESIFIGARISLQVRLYEAVVEPTKTWMKRLLPRPEVLESECMTAVDVMNDQNDDEDSDGEQNKMPIVKPVRRVKRVVKKVN